ncbi:hypothetical protein SUDANB19_00001 [Streptomyces sp. enrichment culture]
MLAGGLRLLVLVFVGRPALPGGFGHVLAGVAGRVGREDVLGGAAAAAGRPQRQTLHDPRVEGAQGPQAGDQGLERGRGGHVPALVLLRQQNGHQEAGDLALVRCLPQGPADRLHDVDGAAAHVGEQHAVQAAAARDVGPLPQQAAGGQDAELRLTALRINPACDLAEDGPLMGGRVETAQPLAPDLTGEAAGRP